MAITNSNDRSKNEKLTGIQFLRAGAAIAVVMHHVSGQIISRTGNAPFLSLNHLGDHGVELFFAISGFIILYAHYHQLGRPDCILPYLKKRFWRILPSTFLVASVWAVLTIFAAWLGGDYPQVDFPTWLSSAFVLPMLEKPAPVVIWTLRNEFTFYILFCLLLANVRIGGILFAAWLLACLWISIPGHQNPVEENILFNTVFSDLNVIFAFGMAAFFAHRHWPIAVARFAAIPCAIIFCLLVYYGKAVSELPSYAFGLSGGALVYSAAQVRIDNRASAFFAFLGDASYSIYLAHLPMIALASPLLFRLHLPANALYAIETLLGTGAGAVMYVLFERPVAKMVARRRLRLPSRLLSRWRASRSS